MREFLRHPTAIPIEIRLAEVASPRGTQALDVSHGGLRFRSSRELDAERIVLLSVPSLQPGFEVRARVAWCRPLARDGWRGDGKERRSEPVRGSAVENEEAWDVGVAFLDARDAWRTRLVEQACHIEAYRRDIAQSEGRELGREAAALEWVERFAAEFPQF